MLKIFFICDQENAQDAKMLWQALQYHLRGMIPTVPWDDDRAICPMEQITEKVLGSALVVILYGPGEPQCGKLTLGPRTLAALKEAQRYNIDYVVMVPLITYSSLTEDARALVSDLMDHGKGEVADALIEGTTYRVDDETRVPLRHISMSFDVFMQKIISVASVKEDHESP